MSLSQLRLRTSHVGFCIAYPLALFVACNALTLERLAKWFQAGDSVDYAALGAYLLAGLCLFIAAFTLLAHRFTVKALALLLSVLSAAATYFIVKYGVAIDSSMIQNTVHTDPTEVRQLLSSQMLPYILFLIVLPTLLIVRTDIRFKASGRYLLDSLKLFGVTLGIASIALSVQYQAIFRAGNVSNKYIVYTLIPINVISGSVNAATKALRPYWRKPQQEIRFDAKVTAPKNLVVVLAVGESSRRKNFSLYGYARNETNPLLNQIRDLHLLNAEATRGSTLYALPMILEKNDIKLATVTSRAGVATSCLVNYTMYDNCAAVGEIAPQHCAHGGKCYDEDVIPLLKENLRTYSSAQRLLILHFGGGSHGPLYLDRHPPEFQRFQPMCKDADVANKCSLAELYNAYDNTILYVDYVLGRTIQALDASGVPYVFIYLSDHGESLLENGMMFHGVPPGVSLPAEQADIPLIVKSSVPVSIAKRPTYQQGDVYDSILALLSVESSRFDLAGGFIRLTDERLTRASRRVTEDAPAAAGAPTR